MKTQRDLFPLGRDKWGYRLWPILLSARGVFGVIFFGLADPAFASATLDALVNAAARFSAAIEQQLVMVKNDPAPAEFAEKTVAYAEAKTAYFRHLREEMPELINIATRRKLQLLQLDNLLWRSRSKVRNSERWRTKKQGFCSSISRAILTLIRRGRNSSVLRKSKRAFTRISMGSISRVLQ
jgi:hypothetical protein